MSKTFTDYTTAVQKEVDDTSAGALQVIKGQVTDTYAEIMRHVGQYLQGSITEDDTVELSKTDYPVTRDASVIHQVAYRPTTVTNFRILGHISLEEYKDNFINRPPSIPTSWFLDGDVINIAPKPSETGTVRRVYTPNIDDISDSNPTSLLPDRYTRTVVLGAIYRFKEWENNLASAQYYQGQYQQALHDCAIDLANRAKPLSPKLYGR